MTRYKVIILLVFSCLAGTAFAGDESVYQVSTIEALMGGAYDGAVSIGDILHNGDTGLGTFDALDGEMVVLGGACYRIKASGEALRVTADETSPFAAVTVFEPDITLRPEGPMSLDEVESFITSRIPDRGLIYAVKITGRFANVKTRSVRRQIKPYPTLKVALADQPTFELRDVTGTMVGFLMPDVMGSGMNVPGYHLHFLTGDNKRGGHVLDCTVADVTIELDETPGFELSLVPGAYRAIETGRSIRELE